MKTSYMPRNETSFAVPVKMAPFDTTNEHVRRIEEWTQKSTNAPPSNKKRSAKDQENNDLEEKSQLIAEAVKLLDNRDKQTRGRTPPNENAQNITHEVDSSVEHADEDNQYYAIGKHFRNSKLSARNYVKYFENKMKWKKQREEVINNTYPSVRPRKKLLTSFVTLNAINNAEQSTNTVVEPDSWRFKATRSVKFAVKPGQQQKEADEKADQASQDDDKWAMKQDNDPDWWRWKLKQRFLQNDELLHKLANQRKKLESSITQGENYRINRRSIFNNKKGFAVAATEKPVIPSTAPDRNSSWHISVEIPSSHMSSSTSDKRLPNFSIPSSHQSKSREPIPNFYTPSKELVNTITTNLSQNVDNQSIDPENSGKQKLKVLNKDPYLAKLLAGNEVFKPEMMLDDNQQIKKHQVSQEYKSPGRNNARRKLSLESLSDTDDELTASKFFNPDVTVLYERLSEMEMVNSNNLGDKTRTLKEIKSREPSDGFLNLPILLETGRFNHYNKLPSLKLITTNKDLANSKQQNTKSSKKSNTLQSSSNKVKKNKTKANFMENLPGTTMTTEGYNTSPPTNQQAKIEDLPTSEWAKKLMFKVKKQDNSTKMNNDGNVMTTEDEKKKDEFKDILSLQQHKYKVPIDQETNLLYHEILMSKWKKDKHNKEKESDTIGRSKPFNHNTNDRKHGEHGHGHHDRKKMNFDVRKSRGLDIWLENIREKAKKDRVISPLPI